MILACFPWLSLWETSDTFSSINWEEGAYLKVEVDEDLDGVYMSGGFLLFSVIPYALYSPTSDEVMSKILSLEILWILSTQLDVLMNLHVSGFIKIN